MRTSKNYVTCIISFLIPLKRATYCQFYSVTPPVLITKITNFWMRVRKVVVYMDASAYQVIWKEVENRIFKHNRIFRHMCMYKQPIFISSVIIRFMCKHYIIYILRYTERLLNVFFLLLAVILSELHEKPRRKDWVTEKST